MPRQFRPKAGFNHQDHVAIQINDDETSHRVMFDGSTKPAGYVGQGQVWRNEWALGELLALVLSGKWEELTHLKSDTAPTVLIPAIAIEQNPIEVE